MSKFKLIHEDEDGAWPLDDYFDYIEDVAAQMPQALRDFATNVDSYALQSKTSLHDARMISLTVSKSRDDDVGVSNATVLEVVFLDQLFEGIFTLRYEGVSSFSTAESGLLNRQATDALLHESLVLGPGLYRHAVLFDGGGGYEVEFSDFSRTESRIAEGP